MLDESKPCMHFGRIEQACVAKYEDGAWYRGKILAINGSEVSILFVDYGNQQRCPLNSLKIIDEEFIKLPPQAYHCTLRFTPEREEKANFGEAVVGKTLEAAFYRIGSDKKYETKLFYLKNGMKVVNNEQFVVPASDTVPAPSESFMDVLTKRVQPKTEIAPQTFDFVLDRTIFTETLIPYVPSITEFWVQPDHKKFEELMERLDALAAKPEFVCNQSFTPAVGKSCLAWFTDERWYRAVIEKLDGDTASVHYVDYGNSFAVSTKNLRTLPAEFAAEPAMAYKCRLHGAENATQEINDKFFELVVVDYVSVRFLGIANNVLQVRLFTKDGADVGETIGLCSKTQPRKAEECISYAEAKFRIHLKSDEKRRTGKTGKGKEGNIEMADSIRVKTQDISEALDKKQEANYEERAVQKIVNKTNYSPGEILSIHAQAVTIFSAWDIWIQPDPSAADEFVEKLAIYTNSEIFNRVPDAQPIVGGQFLARDPFDNLWYRAEVVAIENDTLKVCYFDYGNYFDISAKMLKPLPSSLSGSSPFAQKFALDGLENANSVPDTAQCQNALFGKELTVTFVKKSGENLFARLHDKDGVDLNEQLIDKLVDQSVVAQNASHILPIAIPEKAVEVFVSHVKSNNCFWVQRKSDEKMIQEIETALRAIEKDLLQSLPQRVVGGEIYVVRHPNKQQLFRARADVIVDDCVTVYLVDTGETVNVQKADVRNCPEVFKFAPHMATECSFRTPIYPDQYSDDLYRAFKEATDGFVCHAVFDGLVVGGGIHMLETLYANGVDVLTMLSGRLVSSTPQSGKATTGNK